AQEDALMNEQRMTIVSPSELYSSGSAAMSGSGGANGGTGAGGAKPRFGRTSSMQAAGNHPPRPYGAAQNYDYGTGTSSSPVYRNPYESQSSSSGPYRSPW
ncbi:MAG TPA: hypothetical protein VGG24_03765, partial [Paraburkholderia sp.]